MAEEQYETRASGMASTSSSIGPLGVAARILVGLLFVGLELFWRDPKWWDPIAALGIAALITAFTTTRAARGQSPLAATGPIAHALTVLVAIPLLFLSATSGGALLFYGGSMLIAAAHRNGGCEVTAFSNAVLGRDDQVGCALFGSVDLAERAWADPSSGRPSATE
jgi:hypothetical protein